jgi:predicted helicase
VGQLNENDNNKNRKYLVVDRRVSETYGKDSRASSVSKINDAYVKFFRWAADRLAGRDGIVCYVSNNGFVDQIAFDGMRKHLMRDFTHIDHVDLHGNVRKNPKLSGTTHNVFGIQVGVGITVAVRCKGEKRLRYTRVPELWRKEEKLAWLGDRPLPWHSLKPDVDGTWLIPENATEFAHCMPMTEVFGLHAMGVNSNRDEWVYDFSREALARKLDLFIGTYNAEVDRWHRARLGRDRVDEFVINDDRRIKWSSTLKHKLVAGAHAAFEPGEIRPALYRAFSKRLLFYDSILIHRPGKWSTIFPTLGAEHENWVICCTNHTQIPFSTVMANIIPDQATGGRAGQTFPFYTYSPDGGNRRENITDAALERFRKHYLQPDIDKWDVFHYMYAVLHHSAYREKFADALKRGLPRIPFAPDFDGFAAAGRELARLHVEYETLEPWELEWVQKPGAPLSYRVEDKMRLSKDRTSLGVNPTLTLTGIPAEALEYRLGNRSALEWVVDQFRLTEDDRNGIRSDPNREDDPQYITRLVGQVVRVSVETVRVVRGLPTLFRD